jgi:hypothetical protein
MEPPPIGGNETNNKESKMTKITVNPLFSGKSGRMGNVVFRQLADSRTIMAESSKKKQGRPSTAQEEYRRRFKEAVAYAKTAMKDAEMRTYYEGEAKKLKKTPYLVAISSYMKFRKKLGE